MHTNLAEIREDLLQLHKALLEYQKHIYETASGPMQNPNHFYNLVISDPSFAWLRTLSALVVSIDEMLDSKEAISDEKLASIAKYTNKLLSTTNETDVFTTNYSAALQNDPVVKQLHDKIIALLS